MLIAAAFVPSPPLLVPELAGLAVAETDELRHAVLEVGRELASAAEWVVVGTGPAGEHVPATARGTFRGFGADVVVELGPDAAGEPDPMLPLPALVAGWLRDRTAPRTTVDVHVTTFDTTGADCLALGASLCERLAADDVPRALLVVADGATTLTPKAPGAYDPCSEPVEAALGAALAAGDPAGLADLDAALCSRIGLDGRAAWHTLAGVFARRPAAASVRYTGAPYGVGYHVGIWTP